MGYAIGFVKRRGILSGGCSERIGLFCDIQLLYEENWWNLFGHTKLMEISQYFNLKGD